MGLICKTEDMVQNVIWWCWYIPHKMWMFPFHEILNIMIPKQQINSPHLNVQHTFKQKGKHSF